MGVCFEVLQCLFVVLDFGLVSESDCHKFSFHVHFETTDILFDSWHLNSLEFFWQFVFIMVIIVLLWLLHVIIIFFIEVLVDVVIVNIVNVHVLYVLHKVRFFLLHLLV